MEAKMRWFAATIFAALLAATVPGAAWAETDIVLENESSDTDVQTGESSFTNNSNENVSSGTNVDDADSQPLSTLGTQNTGDAVQGQAEAILPSTQGSTPTTQSLSSVPRSAADLVLTETNQQTTDSFDALFVGLPISDGSIAS